MHSDLSYRFPRSLLSCTVVEAIFIYFDVFYIETGIITANSQLSSWISMIKKKRIIIES